VSTLRTSPFRKRVAALVLVLVSASAPYAVFAAGSETKTKTDKAQKDEAKNVDAGVKDAGPGPVDGSVLPPGHPPLDPDELPPGHPQVDTDEDDTAPANPHAGAQNPHQKGQGKAQFFEPPEDLANDDPTLPKGTLVISIKDADDKPVPNAPIVVGILKSSVAQGDTRDRKALEVDAEGLAKLDDLPTGQGTSYRISTGIGPATYATMPFSLSDKAGKRVTLHVYQASTNIEDVLVGAQMYVFITLKEDVLSVETLLNLFNIGRVSWVPSPGSASVGLPEGYKAFTKPDQMGDVTFVEVKNKGADLTGTIAPGRHETTFRYHVPLDGSPRQTFHVDLPPHVGEARVFAEANKSMGLEVRDFPDAQKQRGRDGRRVLVTMKQVGQGERGLKSLDITVAGLPTKGPGRWIAVLFALLSLGMTITFVVQQKREGGIPEEARADLIEAREALLSELIALEKAKRTGDVGPKTYDRVHAALLDALARIESRLDEIKTQRAEKRRRDRNTAGPRKARPEGGAS